MFTVRDASQEMIEMFTELLLNKVRIDLEFLGLTAGNIGPMQVEDIQVYYNTETTFDGTILHLSNDMTVRGRA